MVTTGERYRPGGRLFSALHPSQSMRPEEFLDFAAELANSSSSGSAAHRSAVSRAYYGVYHAVRSAIEKDLSISCRADSGGNEHKLLVDYLAGSQLTKPRRLRGC